ncbi:MAG: OmpA family protein [Hyphomicrobiaceae bacterium]|nr:OmpA family protein [Hyphomicrobiaceae bacterium]
MRCNWMRWLWGIIPLLILGWLAVEAEHSRIERDLTERSQAEFVKAGLAWAASTFQGRDSTLTGRATEVSDPDKAIGVLRNVWGVRTVDSKADLLEQVANYSWNASRKNNRIRLTGYVPNAAAKQNIMGMARASFPGFEIQDRMRLARGVPNLDFWLGGVSYALKQLTYIERGDVRLDDLSLSASGEAEDANGYRALRSIGNSLPKGIKLGSATISPPTVKPHVFTARFSGTTMAFKGHVPSDTEDAFVVAAARETVADGAITNDTEPGAGAAQGWKDAAALLVRALTKLENGQAEIKDDLVTLTGLAADDERADGVRRALKGLPPNFKLTDQLTVKPKPKPAEPAPEQAIVLPAVPPPPPAPDLEPRKQPEAAPPAAPAVAVQQPAASPPQAPPEAGISQRLPSPPAQAATTPPPAAAVTPAPEPSTAAPAAPSAVTPAPPPVTASPAQIKAAKACEDNLTTLATAGTILFSYGSAEISQSSFETLEKLAAAAKGCPGMTIEIGGFASAEGAPLSNQRLSESRAQSVLGFLVKAGVDAQQLEAKGYGIAKPVAPNTTPENMAKNRRIEFSVRPKAEQR